MAILDFQKPDKVIMIQSDERKGQFEFRPLEPGYGITVGNALRRILLSSLEGYAISSVRIEGVDHEFATLKGIVEDVTEIVLNLKQVRFKQQIEGTDNEKLVLELTTDGSIHPKDALKEAAKILIHHFMLFSDERITLDSEVKSETEEFDETSLHMRQLLKTKLVDMDLSVRALNCLKAADVETLGDLVSYNKNDLLKFRNFGKKSLTELEDLVDSKGLNFGMNVAKYKLDKD